MAITVKEVLDNLTDDERTLLILAFENEVAQYVEIPGGYVGVNCHQISNCTPTLEAGVWSVGELTNENNSVRP